MPCVSIVVSGDFCRFKLALPLLLSMSFDNVLVVDANNDFDAVLKKFSLCKAIRICAWT